jgi:hypothetical protein
MAMLTINGRKKFFKCDSIALKKVSNGRWEVTYDGDRSFLVVGGLESGGARHEWFCYHPLFYGDSWVPAKSMVEAIRLGVQY